MSDREKGTDLPGYAEALDEVQEILATLESDATDVDLLAERVRRADLLLRHRRLTGVHPQAGRRRRLRGRRPG